MIIPIVAETGIGSISAGPKTSNAAVLIPDFPPGTVGPVLVLAQKVDLTMRAVVELMVSPPASCACPTCAGSVDPALTTLRIAKGSHFAQDSFTGIPRTESFLTIQNGSPGVRKLQVLVNGRHVATRWMLNGNSRVIDLASEMKRSGNVITLIANGRPGASVFLLISDATGLDTAAEATLAEAWTPGPADPDVNLHWGN